MDGPEEEEARRLRVLESYEILDTEPDQAFDDLVRIAAIVCDAPMATVTLVDRARQWFKAETGVGLRETPRDVSFCSVAIGSPDPLMVVDTTNDPRFADNPFVTGDLHLRAYLGVPLCSPSGHRLGTICAMDVEPRPFDDRQVEILRLLAGQVEQLLELHRGRREAARTAVEAARTARHLAEAQRIATIGSWEVEGDPFRTWWSDGYYRILGVERGEIDETYETFESFLHPDDVGRFRDARRRAVDAAGVMDVEHRIVRRDGTVRWVHELAEFMDPARQTGSLQDITERHEADVAARQQAYLQQVAGSLLHMGGWEIDVDSGRTIWSDQVYAMHDLPAGTELTVDDAAAFQTAESADEVRRAVATSLRTGEPVDLEVEIVTAAGRARILRTIGEVIRDEDGTIRGLRGASVDVTDRMELEQRVAQLQRLESIGQLTGGVAHDFNNLLTVIIGNADLLSMTLDPDGPEAPLAAMIRTAGERGAQLTSRLLAFARRQALEPRVVDTAELLTSVHQLLERALGEHVEIAMHHEPAVWPIEVDVAQLEAALLNIAINARDAMPGGGHLVIETANVVLDQTYAEQHVEVAPGNYVLIALTDSGDGMTPEVQDRAFEPFFTTKPTGRGSGLGLSMVYGFVKQSGGHVKLYSEAGHGTSVKLYLPQSANVAPSERPTNVDDSLHGGSEVILLVEDDDLVRAHAAQVLTDLGYDVHVAANGPAALALFDRLDHVDLLFTDVVMPGGLNGPQVAEEIQTRRPSVRVLFASGYTENAIVHHGRVDAGVDLLHKPYRRAELAAKVRSVLDRDRRSS